MFLKRSLVIALSIFIAMFFAACGSSTTTGGGPYGGGGTTNPPATPPDPVSIPSQPYTPLTGDERLHGYIKATVGPMTWVTGAFSAGWGQLRDRPHEWGQGARGFGLRMGSGFAQRVTRETLTYGAASLLHEDNRYFRSTDTAKGKRLEYAILSTFLARKEDGTREFSYSRIGGMLGSSLISRTWQPASTGSMNSAGVNFGTASCFPQVGH